MKRIVLIICLLLFLLSMVLTGCENPHHQLQEALNDYCQMIDGAMPEDLRLTVYFVPPHIFTRAPLDENDLKTFPSLMRIVVESDELAAHWERIKKVDMSVLQPVADGFNTDARLYYVLETGNDKILDVVISRNHCNAFVGGIEVEDNPVLYEIITPFLTEDACSTLGI